MEKFHLHKREFITSDEIRKECKSINLNYDNVIRYFISRGYLVRIFRGIFYVKNLEEIKPNRLFLIIKSNLVIDF